MKVSHRKTSRVHRHLPSDRKARHQSVEDPRSGSAELSPTVFGIALHPHRRHSWALKAAQPQQDSSTSTNREGEDTPTPAEGEKEQTASTAEEEALNPSEGEKGSPASPAEEEAPTTAEEKQPPATAEEKQPPATAEEKGTPATAEGEKGTPATAEGEKGTPATAEGEKQPPATAEGEKGTLATAEGEKGTPASPTERKATSVDSDKAVVRSDAVVNSSPGEASGGRTDEVDSDEEDNAVSLALQVANSLEGLASQPLWAFFPLHILQDHLNTKLKDWPGGYAAGKQLESKFPDLKLTDLPMFRWLPHPLPKDFSWNSPLEIVLTRFAALLPLGVRKRGLLHLTMNDIVESGLRERAVRKRQQFVDRHQGNTPDGLAKSVQMLSGESAILRQQKKDLRQAVSQSQRAEMESREEIYRLRSRFEEDQRLLRNQLAVIGDGQEAGRLEQAKIDQLEDLREEQKTKIDKLTQITLQKDSQISDGNRKVAEGLEKNERVVKLLDLKEAEEVRLRKEMENILQKAQKAESKAKLAAEEQEKVAARDRETVKEFEYQQEETKLLTQKLADSSTKNSELLKKMQILNGENSSLRARNEFVSKQLEDEEAANSRLAAFMAGSPAGGAVSAAT